MKRVNIWLLICRIGDIFYGKNKWKDKYFTEMDYFVENHLVKNRKHFYMNDTLPKLQFNHFVKIITSFIKIYFVENQNL